MNTVLSGGGSHNIADGIHAVVTGGQSNVVTLLNGAIGGGQGNRVEGSFGVVGGGRYNVASNRDTVVGGGQANTASESAATVGGGWLNQADGAYATVPGGVYNFASGFASLAAGQSARASHDGSFVWSDTSDTEFGTTADNQFLIRAAGGVGIGRNNPQAPLDVNGLAKVAAIQIGESATPGYVLTADANGVGTWQPLVQGQMVAEGTAAVGSGVESSSQLSDRAAKENLETVNAREVLERVAALPISTWNYRSQATGVRHMGPMAQDFHGAFGLGGDDRMISNIDTAGVALAAIQGLNLKLEEKVTEVESLKKQNADLLRRLELLERRLKPALP